MLALENIINKSARDESVDWNLVIWGKSNE